MAKTKLQKWIEARPSISAFYPVPNASTYTCLTCDGKAKQFHMCTPMGSRIVAYCFTCKAFVERKD